MLNLVVDGQPVQVEKGSTILQACEKWVSRCPPSAI